ncbi:MAG: AAA family ATPase [Chloroflexi bacterium]|nr:AAA family ATPase [Chloroflexota bacterium]
MYYAHLLSEIVFVMGLPGAGKSTWVSHNLKGFGIIDPDRIKRRHPLYNPHRPQLIHRWSKDIAARLYLNVLHMRVGRWVVVGIGSDADEMIFNMQAAQAAGFATRLVYVKCTLEKALARNGQRARQLPAELVAAKAARLDGSFNLTALYANFVNEVDNNVDLARYKQFVPAPYKQRAN